MNTYQILIGAYLLIGLIFSFLPSINPIYKYIKNGFKDLILKPLREKEITHKFFAILGAFIVIIVIAFIMCFYPLLFILWYKENKTPHVPKFGIQEYLARKEEREKVPMQVAHLVTAHHVPALVWKRESRPRIITIFGER